MHVTRRGSSTAIMKVIVPGLIAKAITCNSNLKICLSILTKRVTVRVGGGATTGRCAESSRNDLATRKKQKNND